MGVMLEQQFVRFVRDELVAQGLSARGAALAHGLPVRSIQSVLDGHSPSLRRAEQICRALGIKLHLSHSFVLNIDLTLETVAVDGVDVRDTDGLNIQCSLLSEVLAKLCQEWAETDLRGKERLYRRFCSYFPELENSNVVTQIMWEKSDGIPALRKLERLKEKFGRS